MPNTEIPIQICNSWYTCLTRNNGNSIHSSFRYSTIVFFTLFEHVGPVSSEPSSAGESRRSRFLIYKSWRISDLVVTSGYSFGTRKYQYKEYICFRFRRGINSSHFFQIESRVTRKLNEIGSKLNICACSSPLGKHAVRIRLISSVRKSPSPA